MKLEAKTDIESPSYNCAVKFMNEAKNRMQLHLDQHQGLLSEIQEGDEDKMTPIKSKYTNENEMEIDSGNAHLTTEDSDNLNDI